MNNINNITQLPRIHELINRGYRKYPHNDFFKRVIENRILENIPGAYAQYKAYEQALDIIDTKSWEVLSEKAVAHFIDYREGQRMLGFFSQLNDAFAYEYLTMQGYQHVCILREGKTTQPDIEYMNGAENCFCEVKTINISQDAINRRHKLQIYSVSTNEELSSGFLEKLNSTLNAADCQIKARGETGLIYIIMHFDNIAYEDHWDRYHRQISDCLEAHAARWIYVRIGVLGENHICKMQVMK